MDRNKNLITYTINGKLENSKICRGSARRYFKGPLFEPPIKTSAIS